MEKNLGHATAYGYAKSKGYSGTEEEFAELMADYASVGQSAAQSAERAVSSATSASGSAATASQSAQTATEKASDAIIAEGVATAKAEDAQAYATSANQSAESASTSAQTATTAAATATTKASEASESAATATTAKTDAETARDAAAQSASEAAASAESIDPEALEHKAYGAYVVESASGAITSFADGADSIPMQDVLVHIEPVQEGSGDPSPDNVRPITGWTGAKVTRCGKNLLDISNLRKGNSDGALNDINVSFDEYQPIKGGQTYVWSSLLSAISGRYIKFYDVNKTELSEFNLYGTGAKTLSAPSNARYFRCMWYASAGVEPTDIVADQLELGSTATDYEPYSGQTYPITFPSEAGTVYGGTLDVTRGELMVDRAMVDLGTLSWTQIDTSGSHWRFWAFVTGMLEDSTMISSQYAQITSSVQWTGASGIATQLISEKPAVMVSDERYETAQDFKTAMFGVQLVYELATPITYTLTPQEITSLLGENNVWADTGNTEVEYRASTKMYIDKKITEAVSALS